jgi:hypothetical protein
MYSGEGGVNFMEPFKWEEGNLYKLGNSCLYNMKFIKVV